MAAGSPCWVRATFNNINNNCSRAQVVDAVCLCTPFLPSYTLLPPLRLLAQKFPYFIFFSVWHAKFFVQLGGAVRQRKVCAQLSCRQQTVASWATLQLVAISKCRAISQCSWPDCAPHSSTLFHTLPLSLPLFCTSKVNNKLWACWVCQFVARATTNGLNISDRTDSLWQSTAACSMPTGAAAQRRPMHHQSMQRSRNIVAPQQQHNSNTNNTNNTSYNKMLSSSHSSPREISASPRRVALDTTASGSTSGFGFSRGKNC